MEVENSSDSDGELVIDETIILSSGDEESCPIGKFRKPDKEMRAKNILKVTTNEDNHWSSDGLYQNLFHPESISSSDMKDELYIEETYTCTLCNELFKYNVGLICHMETEHKDISRRRVIQKKTKRSKKMKPVKKLVSVNNGETASHSYSKEPVKRLCVSGSSMPNENLSVSGAAEGVVAFKKSCDVCKKSFSDQNKLSKHLEGCMKVGLNFHCIYCKAKFGWESKYKKHLFRTHKLNAVVICKLCSSVFSDIDSLATHSSQCDKKHSVKKTIITDQMLPNNVVSSKYKI